MIKKIHQIWFQGEQNIPEKYHKYIQSVKDKNQDWTYTVYNENDIIGYASKFSKKCEDTIKSYKHMHQKIDLGRYLICYYEGGITVDIDSECVRSFNEFLNNPLLKKYDILLSKNLSIERCFEGFFASMYMALKSSNYLNNSLIISHQSNSPVLKGLINHIIGLDSCGSFENSFSCIEKTTGPVVFSNYMKSQKTVGYVPFEYISFSDDNNIKIPDMYLLHHVQLSWLNPVVKFMFVSYCKYNKFYIIDVLIVLILLLVIKKIYTLIKNIIKK